MQTCVRIQRRGMNDRSYFVMIYGPGEIRLAFSTGQILSVVSDGSGVKARWWIPDTK